MSDGAPTPLCDLRVVEISDRIAGSYCGKLLVDAGADVVKVEPAAGDPLRRFTATGAVPPAGADSPLFSYLNAGKRSVTTLSDDLLAGADIVVVTANRSAAAERGVDPGQLLEARAGLRRRDDLGLRLDRSVVGASGDGVHPAGRRRLHRVPWRSGRPAHLDRRRAGGVHGRRVGSLRGAGAASSRQQGWPGRASRHVHARGDDVDAERRMAAFAAAGRATGQTLGRGAVDRTRQGRLRRHQHGDGAAVAGLRRDGGLP